MPVKVNLVLDDDVKADLDRLVQAGSRSRVVNRALRVELLAIRRRRAAERLDELRSKTKATANRGVLASLRRDRRRA